MRFANWDLYRDEVVVAHDLPHLLPGYNNIYPWS